MKRVLLLALPLAGILGVAAAIAFYSSTAAGSATASVGGLGAPTIAGATGGAGTVTLSWTSLSPPNGSDTVMYYVSRNGGSAGGSCPTAASPTTVTSCTDAGLSAGTYQYTVTAVWRSWSTTSSPTAVTLTSGALDHFSLTAGTTTPTAGAADNLTITAKDISGNTVTAYGGAQTLTFSGASAIGSFAPTVTDAGGTAVSFGTAEQIGFTNGVATVSGSSNGVMTLYKTGSPTITVSDGTYTGSVKVTVSPAGAANFLITSPGTQTAGQAFGLTVKARDAYGNTATSYAGSKTLDYAGAAASPDSTAPSYPTSATSVNFTSGVGSPSGITLFKAASTTLTVTDDSSPSISGQTTFTVNPSTPASLSKTAGDNQSTPLNAAFAIALKVTVTDAYGNPEKSGTVTFAAPGSGATGNFKASSGVCNNTGSFAGSCSANVSATGTATASTFTANGTVGAYTVSATASGGTNPSVAFALSNGQPPTITSASSTTFSIGTNGTFTVTTTGSPSPALSESGALPSGVTFHDNGNGTATISGNPWLDSNTSYPITITAANGVSPDATQSFILNVNQFSGLGPGSYSVTVPAGSAVSVTNLCGGSGGGGSTAGAGTGGGGGCVSGTIPAQSGSYTLTVTTGSGGTKTGGGGTGFSAGGAGGGSTAGGGGGSSALQVGGTTLIVAAGGGGGSGVNNKGAGNGGSGATTSPGNGSSGTGDSGGGAGGIGNGSPGNGGAGGAGSKGNGGGGGAGANPGAGGSGTGNNGSTASGGGAGGDLVSTSAGSLNPTGISYSALGVTAAGSNGSGGSVTLTVQPSGIYFTNISTTGSQNCSVQPVSQNITCTSGTMGGTGTFAASVEMVNSMGTPIFNTSGSAITVNCSESTLANPGGTVSPSSSTIAQGAVTTASTFTLTGLGPGWKGTMTCSAVVTGTSYTVAVTGS